MASSNRHWPSMFKSKPCNSHLQWPQDVNSSSLLSSACQKTPYASAAPGCEEKTPEPKPRWNPKPEQIKILEAIFNSGMVNPPRDEIRKIRAQLQEYGQVGDANVFYWFQNRKSRSKHKQRNIQASRQQSRFVSPIPEGSSSSSSSSERSTGSEKAPISAKTEAANLKADSFKTLVDPVKKSLFPEVSGNFCDEPFFFSGLSAADLACFVGVPEGGLGLCHGLFTDLMSSEKFNKIAEEDMKVKMHLPPGYFDSAADITSAAAAKAGDTVTDMIQGIGTYAARSTVFINGVAFDVGMGLVNLREAFGENAVLLHSSGLPVLVDDLGVTLHPLQHGASYYLI